MDKFINIKNKLLEKFDINICLFDRKTYNNKNENYGIYIHLNKINGKMYCGQTKQTFTARWGSNGINYKIKNSSNKNKQRKIANAIEKYGWDNFFHIVIKENISKEQADELEVELIAFLKLQDDNFGYNISNGGKSKTISDETKKHMSSMHLKRKVIGLSIKNKDIHIFESIKEANIFIGASSSLVNAAIKKGKGSSSKGYLWFYYEDFDSGKIDNYINDYKELCKKRYAFTNNSEYKDKRRKQMYKMQEMGTIPKVINREKFFKKIVRINPATKEYIIFNSKKEGSESANASLGAVSYASKNGKLSLLKGYLWINFSDFEKLGIDIILDKYNKGEELWS